MKKIACVRDCRRRTCSQPRPRRRRRLQRADPRRHDLRRLGRHALCRRRRAQGRQDRLCRTARAGTRGARRRRQRQGGLARLHQHAELGEREPDRRRPRPERHRAGRHARSHGRRRFHGPADAGDEAAGGASGRATSNIRSTGPRSASISNICSARASRPTSPRSSARPRCACTSSARRTSTRRPRSSTRMRALVRAGDEGRRAGRRLVADLRARDLCRDARAGRAGHRGRQMRRHVHQPHALRGEQAARSDRRADRDQPASPARRPRSTTSSRRASRTGASSTPRSPRSKRRARGGQRITADMYTYTAGATGLDAAMPPWVQAGGLEAWIKRLKDPAVRARLVKEMRTPVERLGESAAARRAAPTRCCWSRSRTRS